MSDEGGFYDNKGLLMNLPEIESICGSFQVMWNLIALLCIPLLTFSAPGIGIVLAVGLAKSAVQATPLTYKLGSQQSKPSAAKVRIADVDGGREYRSSRVLHRVPGPGNLTACSSISPAFQLVEATIVTMQAALMAGHLTCSELIQVICYKQRPCSYYYFNCKCQNDIHRKLTTHVHLQLPRLPYSESRVFHSFCCRHFIISLFV